MEERFDLVLWRALSLGFFASIGALLGGFYGRDRSKKISSIINDKSVNLTFLSAFANHNGDLNVREILVLCDSITNCIIVLGTI